MTKTDVALNIRQETRTLIASVREFETTNGLECKPMPEKGRIELYEGTVIRIAEHIVLKNCAWVTDLPEHYYWDLCRECSWLGDIIALDEDSRNEEMQILIDAFYTHAIAPIVRSMELKLSFLEQGDNPWSIVGLKHPTFGMLVFQQLGDFRIYAWNQSKDSGEPVRSSVSVASELPTRPGEYYLCRLSISIQSLI